MDEPVVRLPGEVPQPHFALHASRLQTGQLERPHVHAVRGFRLLPAIFRQPRLADTAFANQGDLGVRVTGRIGVLDGQVR